jgi:hypothetical protein
MRLKSKLHPPFGLVGVAKPKTGPCPEARRGCEHEISNSKNRMGNSIVFISILSSAFPRAKANSWRLSMHQRLERRLK